MRGTGMPAEGRPFDAFGVSSDVSPGVEESHERRGLVRRVLRKRAVIRFTLLQDGFLTQAGDALAYQSHC
jgi:hypothetical protein